MLVWHTSLAFKKNDLDLHWLRDHLLFMLRQHYDVANNHDVSDFVSDFGFEELKFRHILQKQQWNSLRLHLFWQKDKTSGLVWILWFCFASLIKYELVLGHWVHRIKSLASECQLSLFGRLKALSKKTDMDESCLFSRMTFSSPRMKFNSYSWESCMPWFSPPLLHLFCILECHQNINCCSFLRPPSLNERVIIVILPASAQDQQNVSKLPEIFLIILSDLGTWGCKKNDFKVGTWRRRIVHSKFSLSLFHLVLESRDSAM